ncbi:MAG TPA: 5,6-dimethylbenzimidazole synthase [Methylophaga aminisulfidivorans]|uniref:5,6-dimethylbenzimidazole synthase n=2 Tax=root TaxID=1 RepID=A0A7C1ZRS7_9GAMM|nr:5,6-dimethylbenzimidazole synthase [Methylophaga aminisulfidivorans]
MTENAAPFTQQERDAVYRAIAERRDMRHFRSEPIRDDQLKRLLNAAHQAPSVGLMQPWRIIRITNRSLRNEIHTLVEQERIATAKAMNEREDEFMRLKVEGINDCAEIFIMCLADKREQHIFGRRTMPEMDLASVSCAIQNMWLAARVEGLGMGWVSIFDPKELGSLLHLPDDASPIAILCLGHVDAFYPEPMLQMENWRQAEALETVMFENQWDSPSNL